MSDTTYYILFALAASTALSTIAALYYRWQYLHEIAEDREVYWEVGEIGGGHEYSAIIISSDRIDARMPFLDEGTKVYIRPNRYLTFGSTSNVYTTSITRIGLSLGLLT